MSRTMARWVVRAALCGLLVTPALAECPLTVDQTGAFSDLLARARELYAGGCRPAVHDLAEYLLERVESEPDLELSEVAEALDLSVENGYWLGKRGEKEIARACEAVRLRRQQSGDDLKEARSYKYLGALLGARLDENWQSAKEACRQAGALLGPSDANRAREALEQFEAARSLLASGHGAETADLFTKVVELIEDWGPGGEESASRLEWVSALTEPATEAGVSVAETLDREGIGGIGSGVLEKDPAMAIALRSVALSHGAQLEVRAASYDECRKRVGCLTSTEAYAAGLNVLGKVLNHRHRYPEALTIFRRAFEVRRMAHPSGHSQIARGHHNLGEAFMLVGDLEQARPHLEEGFRLRQAATGRASTSLHLLGRLHFMTGDLQEALRLYRDALPGLEEGYGGNIFYVEGLIGLAEVLEELGEAEEAERQYLDALKVLDRLEKALSSGGTSKPRLQTAAVQARLGTLLAKEDRLREGEELLLAAHATQKQLIELQAPKHEGDEVSAAGKRRRERKRQAQHQDYAQTLRGLAEISTSRNDAGATLSYLREAASYQGSHPGRIDTLLALAAVELEAGAADAAEGTLRQVEGLLATLGEEAYSARARFHYLHARWLVADDQRQDALEDAAFAARLYARHLAPAFRVLPPERALRYARQHRDSLDLALALLSESEKAEAAVRLVWQATALNRGLVGDELEQRYGWARRQGDTARLEQLLTELEQARRHLAEAQIRVRRISTVDERRIILREAAERVGDAEKARASYAAQRVSVAERALAEESAPARAGAVGMLDPVSGLPGQLPEASALVAFVRFTGAAGARYGAFLAEAGLSAFRFIDLGPAVEIDRLVGDWRSALLSTSETWQRAEARLSREGVALRQAVWDPVARLAGQARRFFVVPDGSLFFVPFDALPGRGEGRYLIEEGLETHRLVSERDLWRYRTRVPGARSLLAVGGPDFDAGMTSAAVAELARPSLLNHWRETTSEFFRDFLRDPCRGKGSLDFLPLGGARDEAAEVASIFRQHSGRGRGQAVAVLKSAGATETRFKELAGKHSVLHVATHAFADLECRQAGATRGVSEMLLDLPGTQRYVAGLAFAGANRQKASSVDDDGILTVPEIAGLDLSRAEWVVLSACETGIGQVAAGEGVLGLARAFRVAGARTLILSLWPVADQPTRTWMRELYRARFERRETTAAAMRATSLAVLKERRISGDTTHPFFWAGFVAIGDWE